MDGMKVEEQTLRQLALDPSDEMIKEARQIVEAARERGIVLRLIGGMAVRSLCTDQSFCSGNSFGGKQLAQVVVTAVAFYPGP